MCPSVILTNLELYITSCQLNTFFLPCVEAIYQRHIVRLKSRIPRFSKCSCRVTCYGIGMVNYRALSLFDHYIVDLDDVTGFRETEVEHHDTVTIGETGSNLIEYELNASFECSVIYVNHLYVVLVLDGDIVDRVVCFEFEGYAIALASLSNRSVILNLSTPLTVLIYVDMNGCFLSLSIPLEVGLSLGIPSVANSEPSLPRISILISRYVDAASMPAFAAAIIRTEVDVFLTSVSEVNYVVTSLSRIPSTELVVSHSNHFELIALSERVVQLILSRIVRINSEQMLSRQVMDVPAVDITNEVETVNEVNNFLLRGEEINVVEPEGQVSRIVDLDLVNIRPVLNTHKLSQRNVNSIPLLALHIYRNTYFRTAVDRNNAEGEVTCSPYVEVESLHSGAIHTAELKAEVAQSGSYIFLTELLLRILGTGTPLTEATVSFIGSRVNSVYLIVFIGRSNRSSVRSIESSRRITTVRLECKGIEVQTAGIAYANLTSRNSNLYERINLHGFIAFRYLNS